MANIGQIYYNVLNTANGTYETSAKGSNIFSDVVAAYGAQQFNKLGIQAPPGTKVVINDTKTIMIGRTGIYELDDNIVILSLRFIKPRKYVKDIEASDKLIESGKQKMLEAESIRSNSMEQLQEDYPDGSIMDDEYWKRYNEIQAVYIEAYQLGLDDYNLGVNGVYVLPNQSNLEAEENYQDLYNVIIDFIYE